MDGGEEDNSPLRISPPLSESVNIRHSSMATGKAEDRSKSEGDYAKMPRFCAPLNPAPEYQVCKCIYKVTHSNIPGLSNTWTKVAWGQGSHRSREVETFLAPRSKVPLDTWPRVSGVENMYMNGQDCVVGTLATTEQRDKERERERTAINFHIQESFVRSFGLQRVHSCRCRSQFNGVVCLCGFPSCESRFLRPNI